MANLNLGTQIGTINAAIESISQQGASEQELAKALKQLTEAAISEQLCLTPTSTDLQALSTIAEQSAKKPEERSKGILKALVSWLPTAISAATKLAHHGKRLDRSLRPASGSNFKCMVSSFPGEPKMEDSIQSAEPTRAEDLVLSLSEKLAITASARNVFAEPIHAHNRTIVPVASSDMVLAQPQADATATRSAAAPAAVVSAQSPRATSRSPKTAQDTCHFQHHAKSCLQRLPESAWAIS